MSSPARCQTDSVTTAGALLRAISALGPRPHEPMGSADPAALYDLVCATLGDCRLHAQIAALDASGTLRVAATSVDPSMRAFVERYIGGPLVSSAITLEGLYAQALVSSDVVLVEPATDALGWLAPHLPPERREQLARDLAAERALLAPIPGWGRVSGVITLWGARTHLSQDDAPALLALAAQLGGAVEQARLARELASERARWQAAVEDLANLVIVCDGEGRLTYLNASARRLFAAHAPTLAPEVLHADEPLLRPDGSPFAVEDLPLEAARLTGKPVPATSILLRGADGGLRHLVWTASPLRGPSGTIEGAMAVGRDLTREELLERQSYSALRVVLHLADIATTPGQTPTPAALLTRLVEALLGLEGLGYVHAMLIDEAAGRVQPVAIGDVSPAVAATWRDELEAFRLMGLPSAQSALEELRAGHVLRQDLTRQKPLLAPNTVRVMGVQAAISAPVLDDNRLIGLLTIGRSRPPDLASQSMFAPFDEELLLGVARLAGQALTRARLAAELTAAEAARLAAEEATRQRDAFLSTASHELRTPLTSIKTLLYLLQRHAGVPAWPLALATEPRPGAHAGTAAAASSDELLSRMGRQVDRLVRLVDDLLETSRIDTDHLELHRERADLVALVRQAAEEQRQITPGRAILLRVPSRPLWAEVDSDRIGQVIANYLTNALKYSAADQPVMLSLRVTDGTAQVAVRDHGPGVPAAERELVWQRFHRVPGTQVLSGSGIGLGIGLYISKTFVERHGGRVGVRQARGGGAIFWFSLPLA